MYHNCVTYNTEDEGVFNLRFSIIVSKGSLIWYTSTRL